MKNYTQQEIDKIAEEIEKLEHHNMCHLWRFGSSENPMFNSHLITSGGKSLGGLFADRLFKHFGGFTPEISKEIGW